MGLISHPTDTHYCIFGLYQQGIKYHIFYLMKISNLPGFPVCALFLFLLQLEPCEDRNTAEVH